MRLAVITSLALLAFAVPPTAGAQVTRDGILGATVSESFEEGESRTAYALRSGGRTTPLLPTAPVTAATGDLVEATGTIHEGRLVGEVTQQQDLTEQADVVGAREVAVILFKFPGESAPWSVQQARDDVFTGARSANAYFQEESYGGISLTGKLDPEGDVFGWYTLSAPPGGCSADAWDAEAKAAAEAAGVDFSGYEHIVYMFPYRSACSWLGRATLGGKTVNINGSFGGSQVVSHELGHNMYLGHAGSWICTEGGARVPIGDSCSTSEYGDPFDVMGNLGTRHNSGWNLFKLGVLTLSENVQTVGSAGTYTLKAARTPSPAPKVIRIARAVSGGPIGIVSWYYLEIREQGGIFENFADATMSGVSIRLLNASSTAETVLLDGAPGSSSFYDAPFQVGHTFSDGGVHVTVLSAGGGTATVAVGFGAYEDEEQPSAPGSLVASQVGDDVRLQWSAATDNVAVARYAVFRDGSEIGTSPGTSFTDAGPAEGLHAYTVYAEDEAGNRSEASSPAVVTVESGEEGGEGEGGGGGGSDGDDAPAPSPPTVPAPAPPPGGGETEPAPVPRVKPILRWRRLRNGAYAVAVRVPPSADARRVGLWINGNRLRWKRGRAFRLRWRPRRSRCPRAYRLRARAYERAANGRIIATTRLGRIRVPGRAGDCRHRARRPPAM